MASEFMQAILDAAVNAMENEPAKSQIKGISRDQILAATKAITDGIGTLPPESSLHAALFAITFVRNALILAMEDNQRRLESTGGTPQ